ncbi:MAG: 4-hydroxy-tetrahydrodipicolinate reductase [Desulfuromonas sp.]|nr:MAG: 4-hydroxy-tetrahydrodipicolinate reductase [Desulfuromonas sp.]
MTKVAVTGAAGRMGGEIITAIREADGLALGGALERPGHPLLDMDAGNVASGGGLGVKITDSLEQALADAEVLIDFTLPEVTLANVETCRKLGKKVVIGTTGLTASQKQVIEEAAKEIAIVMAPNMSVGVNLCFKLIQETAKALGDDFDVEIVELHHNKKKDSPSGTAVRMGEVAADALGRNYDEVANFHRQGMCGERTKQEIGMQTVRGGDIVGEHTAYFIGMGERIEISHRAMSRTMFARGAVRAATWLGDKNKGLFDMQDVLGLK